MAGRVRAGQAEARLGEAWRGAARRGEACHGVAGRGKARASRPQTREKAVRKKEAPMTTSHEDLRWPVSVSVRILPSAVKRGPRIGQSPGPGPPHVETYRIEGLPGGHFDEYRCPHCQTWLLTRATPHFVRSHGGPVCPSCAYSGVICTRATETVIPG